MLKWFGYNSFSHRYHNSFNFPRILSSSFSSQGPAPKQVIVPGSIWVFPASLISSAGIPALFTCSKYSSFWF